MADWCASIILQRGEYTTYATWHRFSAETKEEAEALVKQQYDICEGDRYLVLPHGADVDAALAYKLLS